MRPVSSYKFTQDDGTFRMDDPLSITGLYFPLTNEQGLLSAITPDLQGDIKLDQHSFLTLPVSFEDLHLSRASRNFWISVSRPGSKQKTHWAVNGRSTWQRALPVGKEQVSVEAGFLWHEVARKNSELGLQAKVLSFVPFRGGTFEIMRVTITNISKKPLDITGVSAIPLYGRSADNLRDHRHVTSLLNRLTKGKFGLSLVPTMSFNERGHKVNKTSYFVSGVDEKGQAPVGVYPTVALFAGEGGDLERPVALFDGVKAQTSVSALDQGKESMGALVFPTQKLRAGESATFLLFLGIDPHGLNGDAVVQEFGTVDKIQSLLEASQRGWKMELSKIEFRTGDRQFDQWLRWVQLQPTLRKIFGCSFLPDFDYGRGGRGWRDLWQDCLALLLANPQEVRDMIRHNFAGVRIDGSNATIIGRKETPSGWKPEFIADRNNITRTWMDHGVWPFLTTMLYVNQTGDWNLLLEKMPYFRDAQLRRGKKLDLDWMREESADPATRCLLKDKNGTGYEGTLLEHILVQHLVQFFNVGEHNIIRLEDADWNDGLDMAHERGESVAFSSLYASNLQAIADALKTAAQRASWKEVRIARELLMLLDHKAGAINYNNVADKRRLLEQYFETAEKGVSGEQAVLPIQDVIDDLEAKSEWMKQHINKNEWIEAEGHHWFNGYYDNAGQRVEGKNAQGKIAITLTGQVYPIMGSIAPENRVAEVIQSVDALLWDEKLGGIRLNSDFGSTMPTLGRAFSFAFGEKENGAVFSHMVVMYANALYQRGFAPEGYRALMSLYRMATNCKRSRIFPGLPEYFNNEGRGRYHFLTGSASWFVLTMLTQVFGVRGESGDLLIAPKLEAEQFNKAGEAQVSLMFAGVRLTVMYKNPKRVPYDKMKIETVHASGAKIDFHRRSAKEVVIARSLISKQDNQTLVVSLGRIS